jgi:hypothetical protein
MRFYRWPPSQSLPTLQYTDTLQQVDRDAFNTLPQMVFYIRDAGRTCHILLGLQVKFRSRKIRSGRLVSSLTRSFDSAHFSLLRINVNKMKIFCRQLFDFNPPPPPTYCCPLCICIKVIRNYQYISKQLQREPHNHLDFTSFLWMLQERL